MNINAYDIVDKKYSRGTWFDPHYCRIYSTEIEYHPYCTFLKRYDNVNKHTDYFIALSDKDFDNANTVSIIKDYKGIIKIDAKSIVSTSRLIRYTEKDFISIEVVDKFDDGIIYALNL